MLPYSQRSEVT